MIPTSRQWTMPPSADIFVYPLSRYVITPTKKTAVEYQRIRRTSCNNDGGGCGSTPYQQPNESDSCSSESSAKSSDRVQYSTCRSRRRRSDNRSNSGYLIESPPPQKHQKQHQDRGHGVKRHRRSSYPDRTARPGRGERRRRRRSDSGAGRGSKSVSHADDLHRSVDFRRRNTPEYREHRGQRPCEKVDDDSNENVTTTRMAETECLQRGIDDTPTERAKNSTRYSANVVLLAHGNRSLHVLTIQRSQTSVVSVVAGTVRRRKHHRTSAATVVVRYKLPGGQLMMTDDEQENYRRVDRNACTCYDDHRWCTAALKHISIQSMEPLQYPTDQPWTDLSQHLVLLGKWYRTQDKETREQIISSSNSNNPQCFYYPYKPAHISHQAIEQKRVYAVLDTQKLFHGRLFHLQAPHSKIKTIASPDGTRTTKTTTYKCKFIPLARFHENNRLYGPVLSSIPAILSGMNVIYLP